MPKIRDDVVRAVIDRAKIEDVVGEFVTLRRAGVNMTGICPFHDDKHDGNFIVRPSTIAEKNHGNTYRCFVCDAKGGPVQFLMNAEMRIRSLRIVSRRVAAARWMRLRSFSSP